MFDSNYPYHYSCKYISDLMGVEVEEDEATQMRRQVAEQVGLSDEVLAILLADRYQVSQGRMAINL